MAEAPSCYIVAAIDIGSYSSGYAYSFISDPMKIATTMFYASEGLLTNKTPTCVLLNPRGHFDSFGFEAEDKFTDLVDDQEDTGWMFFQSYPLTLYNSEVHIIVVA